MVTKTVDVADTNLEELLALIKAGEEVIFTDGETPVAHPLTHEAGTKIRVTRRDDSH